MDEYIHKKSVARAFPFGWNTRRIRKTKMD